LALLRRNRNLCTDVEGACVRDLVIFERSRKSGTKQKEQAMGFGRGVLLWLLGVPLPIVILLALFWHH